MTNSEPHFATEIVPPHNGRFETLGCLLALVLVLLLGGLGVLWNQAEAPPVAEHLALSHEDKALLTQLSSAASEIRFLAGENTGWPSTQALSLAGVPPFDASQNFGPDAQAFLWDSPEPGCYIGLARGPHIGLARGPHHRLHFLLRFQSSSDVAGSLAEIYTREHFIHKDDIHKDDIHKDDIHKDDNHEQLPALESACQPEGWQLRLSGF